MKKTALLIIVVLLGVFAITEPRVSVLETELSYKPRNAKGTHLFASYLEGAGQINLVNGNLHYSRQIVSRPGRAGLDLDLSIHYNSKIWDRANGGMHIEEPGSWAGIGWYLGFARLIQGTAAYAIMFPDGSSHEIQQLRPGKWESVDSTYIQLDVPAKTATLRSGMKLIFGNTIGNISYMTEMKDRNGNRITATYLPGTGKLDEVFDTLGKAAKFHYMNGYLDSVVSYGKVRATIYFNTSEIGPDVPMPSFSIPTQAPVEERSLDSITISLDDRSIIQEYGYDSLGEITSIQNRVVDEDGNTSRTLARFQFGTRIFADSVFGQVEERVVTAKTEYSSETRSFDWAFAYSFSGNASNPSKTSVTDVRGITEYSFNASTYPVRTWSDGLVSKITRKSLDSSKAYRAEHIFWEQDRENERLMLNPRRGKTIEILDNGRKLKTRYIYANDGTGNVKRLIKYRYDDESEILRSVRIGYLHEADELYAAAHMTSLPAWISVRDGDGEEISRTEYGYDEHPLAEYSIALYAHDPAYNTSDIHIRGNRTSIRNKLIEENRYLTATTQYDTLGNPVSVTDAMGTPTTVVYDGDTNYVFPKQTTNALGHQMEHKWRQYSGDEGNYYNGDLEWITDANGARVYYWYDQLGRKHMEQTPVELKYYAHDDANYLSVQVSSSQGIQFGISDTTGNLIESIQEDPEGAAIVSAAEYDNPWGQISAFTLPHREGAEATKATITYDALGRKLEEFIPGVGTTSHHYEGNSITTTDPEGNKKKTIFDELRKIAQILEQDEQGELTIRTKYFYNALGKLVKIVQVGQGSQSDQIRKFKYDSLGRLMSETFPETGTVSYSYDDSGNILTKMDARGVVITSTYDALNRRTGTFFSDGTPSATYAYDETGSDLMGLITNSKGKLTSAWTSNGVGYSWTYDIAGRPTQQTTSIDGQTYNLELSYLDEGCACAARDLQHVTYPDGYTVGYKTDLMGRLTSIYDASLEYVKYSYNSENGMVSGAVWGDGFSQEIAYNAIGRTQRNLVTDADGSYIQWDYAYNGNSKIAQIGEQVYRADSNRYDEARFRYAYDRVGRIKSTTHETHDGAGFVADQINSYTYDRFGNMLSNQLAYPLDHEQDWEIAFNVNPRNNRVIDYATPQGTVMIAYDDSGNMLAEGAKSYAYDGAGRLTGVGTSSGRYEYDAFGRRIKTAYSYLTPSGSVVGGVISIYGPRNDLMAEYRTESSESATNQTVTDYINQRGQVIALRIVSADGVETLQFLHRNHQNQVYDPATYTVSSGFATAQGQPFSSGGDNQFTGHKDDRESGLHYNLARMYNPAISRWASPDSILQNAYDPQSLNKYGFNRNDPVNLMDADGRGFWGSIWGAITSIGSAIWDGFSWFGDYIYSTIFSTPNYYYNSEGGIDPAYYSIGVSQAIAVFQGGYVEPNMNQIAICVGTNIWARSYTSGLNLGDYGFQSADVTVADESGGRRTYLTLHDGNVAALMQQMCSLGFYYSGAQVCSYGASGDVGPVHSGYDYNFRDTNIANSVQVNAFANSTTGIGDVEIDIDLGNPSSGLLGLIIHGVQVGVNTLTQNDNNYNCGT